MKINKKVKILIFIAVVLSIGFISKAVQLTYKDKNILHQDTPKLLDKSSQDIKEPIKENPIIDNNKKDEEIKEKEKEKENKPPKGEEDKNIEDKQDKKDKENKKEDKDKDKDNKKPKKDKNDKKEKEKPIVKSKYISQDKAIEIGLKKVGGGSKLIKVKSDLKDNPPKYELKITLGNYEYELEIHAITGAVIDFDKDEIDD